MDTPKWFLHQNGVCSSTPDQNPVATFDTQGHCEGFREMYQRKSGGDRMLDFSPFVSSPGHLRDAIVDTPHNQWHALVTVFADQTT